MPLLAPVTRAILTGVWLDSVMIISFMGLAGI
jgi:hypothetical protein